MRIKIMALTFLFFCFQAKADEQLTIVGIISTTDKFQLTSPTTVGREECLFISRAGDGDLMYLYLGRSEQDYGKPDEKYSLAVAPNEKWHIVNSNRQHENYSETSGREQVAFMSLDQPMAVSGKSGDRFLLTCR